MRLQIVSDIHEEFTNKAFFRTKENLAENVDAVLIAGDITIPRYADRLDWYDDVGVPFYYVLGNHEFYHGHWEESLDNYKNRLKDTEITLLENETIVIGNNIRLIGSTLWTDFWVPTTQGLDYHGRNCSMGMSDFIVIQGITIEKWIERHKKSLEYIKFVLSTKHDGPTIVMTHHAPSFKSSHPKYDGSMISGGFCSQLDYVIEEYQPEYWIHGHCHESFDYNIGKTRILCNPRGYLSTVYPANTDFNPKLTIEL
jgi:predicted phosphodiesterase